MKAGIYARVSTDNQQSTNQLIELRDFAKRRGYDVEEFVDHGYSGALGKDKRPELNRLMKAAHDRKIDVVVCWDLSRFARSLKQLVDAIEDFRMWGIGFTTLRESIDTNTANGRLVFHIFAGLAEFERELIRERVNLGLRRARAEGKVLGRPRVEVNIETVKLRAMGDDRPSTRKLAALFGVSKSWVSKVLSIKPVSKPDPIIVGDGH